MADNRLEKERLDLLKEQEVSEKRLEYYSKQRAKNGELSELQAKRELRVNEDIKRTKVEIADLDKQIATNSAKELRLKKSVSDFNKSIEKTQKEQKKSMSGILTDVLKLNFASIIQKGNVSEQVSQTVKLKETTGQVLKDLQQGNIFGELEIDDKSKIVDLTKGIADGTYDATDAQSTLNSLSDDGKRVAQELLATEEDASGETVFKSKLLSEIAIAKKKELEIQQEIEEANERVAEKQAVTNRLSVIGIGIFGSLLALAKKFGETIDKVGETFGSLNNLGDDLTTSIVGASTEVTNLGFGVADVNSAVSILSSEFGVSLEEAANLSAAVLDTAKATGLSVDEATKLTGELRIIAGLSQEQSEALIEGTAQLARQAGVAPQQVLKDIAGSSETIATFTKDSGENLFEAAVQARQFGLNIDSVAKAARSSLDFESSINAELEASVLLGTQLNLQRARQLALDKDLVGFQKEIKNQLSDIGDFSELNVLEQESLAKAVGMSVSEVSKLVSGTEKLSVAGALAAGGFDDLAGQDALSNLSAIVGQVKELSVAFLNELGPQIMTALEGFKSFLGNEEKMASFKGTITLLANAVGFVATNFVSLAAAIVGLKATFGVLSLLKSKLFVAAIAGALNVSAKSALAAGPLAAVVMGVLAASLTGLVASLMSTPEPSTAQTGISGFGGGLLQVGESGPEIMNVPRGTSVMSAEQTRQTLSGGSQVDINPLIEATKETTRAISNLNITAGRGEIRVAMEPQMGGNL